MGDYLATVDMGRNRHGPKSVLNRYL